MAPQQRTRLTFEKCTPRINAALKSRTPAHPAGNSKTENERLLSRVGRRNGVRRPLHREDVGHERSSRTHRQGPVRCHPALIPAALMIGHQFSISVFWNAASASAKINTEARSFSCLLRPTICRCHADLADWLDDQPVPGEGQPSFERHVTGERQSVADRVAE